MKFHNQEAKKKTGERTPNNPRDEVLKKHENATCPICVNTYMNGLEFAKHVAKQHNENKYCGLEKSKGNQLQETVKVQ